MPLPPPSPGVPCQVWSPVTVASPSSALPPPPPANHTLAPPSPGSSRPIGSQVSGEVLTVKRLNAEFPPGLSCSDGLKFQWTYPVVCWIKIYFGKQNTTHLHLNHILA